MKDVLVVGGGFAGVWSAAAAVRAARAAGARGDDVRVTLMSGQDDLVIRPRLYESDPGSMRVPLDRILGPVGVRRVAAVVNQIDIEERTVGAIGRGGQELTVRYDSLVVATGSQVVRPNLDGAEHLFDIDTLESAAALDHHIQRLSEHAASPGRFTAVVVGAGFTGIELAAELGDRLRKAAASLGAVDQARVVLVDRANVIGPELGAGPRPRITDALDELKIEQRLATTLASVSPTEAILSDGEVIPAGTVVWTAGMVASPLTRRFPAERDELGRLGVDSFMRVPGVPQVYAAGDAAAAIADADHISIQSCQHAQPMGKCAGHNAVTDLLGDEPMPFVPDPYTNCLDLGPAGAVATAGWDRTVRFVGEEAKTEKQNINTKWIYPPLDSPEALLAQAGRLGNG